MLFSENKQCPFGFILYLDSLYDGPQPYLSKYTSFKYETLCVLFDECNLTTPTSLQTDPFRRYIPTSFKDKDEKT